MVQSPGQYVGGAAGQWRAMTLHNESAVWRYRVRKMKGVGGMKSQLLNF